MSLNEILFFSVYQTIIFAKILEKNGMKCSLDFNRNHSEDAEYMSMCSPKVRNLIYSEIFYRISKV